ncbi:MAG: peptidoglycan DD-metalloendopeptidase family protein [Erysipelotrichaceae bacterium]
MKILKCLLAFSLVFMSVITVSANTDDFKNNEEKYIKLCSTSGLSDSDKKVCKDFQVYLQNKSDGIRDELDKINHDIKDIQANLKYYLTVLDGYNKEIASLESQINALNQSIKTVEGNIVKLQTDIDLKQNEINEKNNKIKARMELTQGMSSTNYYIDFIFGATSFSDLIRRIEGIKDITAYDQRQIKELEDEILKLDKLKDELLNQQVMLEENKKIINKDLANIETLKAKSQVIIKEYQKKEAELFDAQTSIAGNLDAIKNALANVSEALNSVVPSAGWIYPVQASNGFVVSAGTWYYPGGDGIHFGADFAATFGSKLVAPANGIVLYVADRCPSWGSYGNSCGYPGLGYGGNQVLLAIKVGEYVYVVNNMHLQSGVSNVVHAGKIVSQGQTIGYIGSSGSSTGPHVHHEVIFMGKTSLESVVETFRRTGDLSMGTGRSNSTGLSNRCSVKGYSPPCKERPEDIYHVKYPNRYY